LGIQPGEVTDDGLFSIECVNCLGACALGPIASENGSFHHHMTPAKLKKFIESIRRKEMEVPKNA
jgi:NADH:ubiquinone oxidoreductase subunit E